MVRAIKEDVSSVPSIECLAIIKDCQNEDSGLRGRVEASFATSSYGIDSSQNNVLC